jgi:hypothetical protein
MLAVDVTRQPDGAVKVVPLAVVSGVSAVRSSMLGFAGWPAAVPAKLRERTSVKTPTQRMQFLQYGNLTKRQDHHPEERRFGARARRGCLISVLNVCDLFL